MKTAHKTLAARAMSLALRGARSLVGRPPVVRTRRAGVEWELDLKEGIDLSIFAFGAFEPETAAACRTLVKPGQTVLDIGANIGAHTLPLAQLVTKTGRVIAYEPTDFAFAKLKRNISLNPELSEQITAVQSFLADSEVGAPDQIFSSWPVAGSGEVHQQHKGRAMTTIGARTLTLDRHLQDLGVAKVDFVKLDVDGHECGVLRGAQRMLRESAPLVLMELAPYVHVEIGHDLAQCFDALRDAGYKFYRLSGEELPNSLEESARLIKTGESWNVLARADN